MWPTGPAVSATSQPTASLTMRRSLIAVAVMGSPVSSVQVTAINDLRMVNDAVGWMVADTAGPVGHILFTFTGGRYWTEITTPTNSGLNRIALCDESHAIVVGEANGGTAVIIRVEPQP